MLPPPPLYFRNTTKNFDRKTSKLSDKVLDRVARVWDGEVPTKYH